MTNATCLNRVAENLGSMQDARFLGNCLGIRVTRTHLLATGQHIDLSTLAQQAGYRIHVFVRREAFEKLTLDSATDLFNTLNSMREALMKAPLRDCPVLFQAEGVSLVAYFGVVDHDDPRRAITVALASPDED